MPNFFTDNPDLISQFDHLDIGEIVELVEHGYSESEEYAHAPKDYQDAIDNYRKVLEIVGDIAGNFVAPRAAAVDVEEAQLEDGKVVYAKGTREALEQLSQAELMGVTLPRKYGGLNFPTTIYLMAIEMISRADASLMNIFGLQDIGETINQFGDEDQRLEFLPKLADGSCTGAMALTEPDAGSDLQAVKLQAAQDENGAWRLRGVKRFITNGNGEILLVLARSEPGTKDGRGLSLFACYGGDSVKVRRIEHKLGIHGSPTCELQFIDTPAQLIGKRKFGLIKYVMALMNGARLGVSAQALGIAQAAYEEASTYAKAREQFGTPICDIPPVTNMLIDMRVALESNRSLLYSTAKWVDLHHKLEGRIAELKAEGKPFSDEMARFKKASKIVALLTPMTKHVLTESSNRICYDSLQIHGGAGYMREFNIERLVRDVRVTNIYEGTSQLQIVAAIGGVTNDVLADYFDEKERESYPSGVLKLADYLKEMRKTFLDSLKFVVDRKDKSFQEVTAKELVEMYSYLYVGYLLLDETRADDRKIFVANRYIVRARSNTRSASEAIFSEQFSDLPHADKILT